MTNTTRDNQLPTIGMRVRAVNFGPSEIIDDNKTVPPGTLGTVTWTDDSGITARWDNGALLGMLYDHDVWELPCRNCHEPVRRDSFSSAGVWTHAHADKDIYCGTGDGAIAEPTYAEGGGS